jgi:plastocyanin
MKQALIVLAILILVGLGVVVAKSDKKDNASSTNTAIQPQSPEPPVSSSESTSANPPASQEKVITYSASGFSPASLTVNSGDKVTVKNASSNQIQFDSNPHPQHTEDPELNIGIIMPGKSETITVTTKGSHGFHNHLNPGATGTLVVQ